MQGGDWGNGGPPRYNMEPSYDRLRGFGRLLPCYTIGILRSLKVCLFVL